MNLITACKNFKNGKCIYGNERCWFKHEKDDENKDKEHIESKDFENNEVVQKIFKMMETRRRVAGTGEASMRIFFNEFDILHYFF